MKIAIISPGGLPVPPIKGGAVENLIYTIIKENELSSKPIMIDVYSIEDEAIKYNNFIEKNTNYFFIKKEKIKNEFISKLKTKIRNKLRYSYFLDKSIELMKNTIYDFIIIENRPGYVMKIKNRINSKIILHMHNEHLTSFKNYQKAIDSCYKIIVVSNYIKETISKKYYVDEKKIQILHNGIDINRFNSNIISEKNILRNKFNLSKNDFVVLFSGRLVKEKGILELINSIPKCNNIKNLKLLIVGASWFSNSNNNDFTVMLKNKTTEISDKVIFTGYIDYSEIHNIYKIADIAVLPSIWNDPFPLTVLECMGVGLPVISTKSGGIPEMIDNESGILLSIDKDIEENIAKSINYLFTNTSVMRLMSSKAAEKVQLNFSNEKFYKEFIRILN